MTVHETGEVPEDADVSDGDERLLAVVRLRMRELGLNAAQLAARVPPDPSGAPRKVRERFYKVLNGERGLTPETLRLIADALDSTVFALRRDAGLLTPEERRLLERRQTFAEYIDGDLLLGPEAKRALVRVYEQMTRTRSDI